MTSDEHTWRVGDTVRDDNFLYLVTKRLLDDLAQLLELLDIVLTLLLLLLCLLQFKTLLGDTHQLLAIELLELSDGVLVDRVNEEQHFEALLLEHLQERRVSDSSKRFTGQVIDRLLDFGHTSDVI